MSDKAPEVVATGVVFLILPVIAVGFRFYARRLLNTFGWDDYLIIPALICSIGAGVALLHGAAAAKLGQHYMSTVIPPATPGASPTNDPNTIEYEKHKYVISITSTLAVGLTKLSILLLYRRIFSQNQWFRYITILALALIAVWTIGFTFALIFQCNPIAASWEIPEFLLTPYCFNFLVFYNALPITDLITDIMVLVMPMPMVWQLHLPVKQRLAVGGIFLLGALVCAASSARLAIFQESLSSFGSFDETYNAADAIVWSYIECSLAVVSACLPTLRPLFRKEPKKPSKCFGYSARCSSEPGYSLKTFAKSNSGHTKLEENTIDFTREWDPREQDGSYGCATQVESKPMGMASRELELSGIKVEHQFTSQRESV